MRNTLVIGLWELEQNAHYASLKKWKLFMNGLNVMSRYGARSIIFLWLSGPTWILFLMQGTTSMLVLVPNDALNVS